MLMFFMLFLSFIFLMKTISYFKTTQKGKDAPFECGITSNSSSRKPYSIPFFFTTLVFLLFDIEIVLIFPFIYSSFFSLIFVFLMFILLMLGMIVEWRLYSLEWITKDNNLTFKSAE